MKLTLIAALLLGSGISHAQSYNIQFEAKPNLPEKTITTTTETIREETTIITVTQSGSSDTTIPSVPIVYKCNGRTCIKP